MSSTPPGKSILKRKMMEGEENPPEGEGDVPVVIDQEGGDNMVRHVMEQLGGLDINAPPKKEKLYAGAGADGGYSEDEDPPIVIPSSPGKPKVKKLSISLLGGSMLTEEDLIRLDGGGCGCPEKKEEAPKKKEEDDDADAD